MSQRNVPPVPPSPPQADAAPASKPPASNAAPRSAQPPPPARVAEVNPLTSTDEIDDDAPTVMGRSPFNFDSHDKASPEKPASEKAAEKPVQDKATAEKSIPEKAPAEKHAPPAPPLQPHVGGIAPSALASPKAPAPLHVEPTPPPPISALASSSRPPPPPPLPDRAHSPISRPSPAPRPPTVPPPPAALAAAHALAVAPVPVAPSNPPPGPPHSNMTPVSIRTDLPRELRAAPFHVLRTRAYSFVLDARGLPVEVGSGRFAKAYWGEERWLESKTDFRREVIIKILQRGVSDEDHLRFQMEKELLERVQGHPNIVRLYASGESEDPEFIPASIREQVDSDFMVLERLELSLEERLKGSRARGSKEDLLACDRRERVFRALDYVIPVASAVEYAHLVKNICHRDIKPANILLRLPDPNLRGSTLEVRLADFNVAKLNDAEVNFGVTMLQAVPGTLFFQSPEQETNTIELLVNVTHGAAEVEFFEDFYIHIAKNDKFSLFNQGEAYSILYADRARKRIVLGRPYKDSTVSHVRAKIQKSVGRPADIYSLGALLYYLVTGAYGNPKTLYDAFHKFIEYERDDEANTIEAYLEHEYSVISSLSAPRQVEGTGSGSIEVAPADRFFSYKHYLDGNGELIDRQVMTIIARCMIRNKPDSYCQAHDIETRGISDLVADLIDLYSNYGLPPALRPANIARRGQGRALMRPMSRIGLAWLAFLKFFRRPGLFRRH